jgi:EAL domain-containing protein (putative c-di-GMP-specific phosphodiesterase class I)
VTEGVPDGDVTELLLSFVEGTSDLVGVVDEQSRVTYLNQAARKRLGVGDVTGLTTSDLFPPEVFARYYEEIRPTLLRAGTWHGELAVLTESGEAVPMKMTIVGSVGPGGEVNGLVTHGRLIEVDAGDDAPIDTRPYAEDVGEVRVPSLADELAVAVSHGLIQPHVQPVVDLARGVVVGYQGLARWEHPRRGILEAEQFVEILANSPVLPVVDLAVLRRTAAAAARAARNGTRVRAYGHLSQRLIGDVDVARYLAELVDELRIAPSDLCVEIAQTFVARPSPRIVRGLRDLRAIGVRMVLSAVDGECEVNQIVEYGFDELRLARQLVKDAGDDAKRRRVAEGTIALARALGLTVIAVGIDTDADRVTMREAGCDYGQGDLFGPVQPAGEIT